MFRQTSSKVAPKAPLPSGERKIINPTSMREEDQRHLAALIATSPEKIIYQKDIYHPAVHQRPASVFRSNNFHCLLSHTLIKHEVDGHQYFEVVGKEYPGSILLNSYDIVGLLEFNAAKWQYTPYTSLFSLQVKKQIDPVNLTPEESRFLGAILLRVCSGSGEKYLPAGSYAHVMNDQHDEMVVVHLNLKHPILARLRENSVDQMRFEVIGEEIGSGAFSTVFNVLATLIPQTDGSLLTKNSGRILKMQYEVDAKVIYADQEYQHAKLTPHLHTKRPVFSCKDKQKISFMIGKFMRGHSLEHYLQKDADNPFFTLDQRLRLSVALINALQEQIHQRDIIHRDIKPANIIVSFDAKDYPQAFYIDLGLSKNAAVSDQGKACGTQAYVSPEAWRRENTTTASDVFSLGIVLGEVWRTKHPTKLSYEEAINRLFPGLFAGVTGLSDAQKKSLKQFIRRMCTNLAKDRCTLADAATFFEQLRFECALNQADQPHRKKMHRARAWALNLRREIHDYYLLESEAWDVNAVRCQIERVLLKVPDEPALISEFVTSLDIHALHGLSDREGISRRMKCITADYVFERDGLRIAIHALDEMMLSSNFTMLDPAYQEYLKSTLDNSVRRGVLIPASVDDVVALTKKTVHDVCKIKRELEYISHLGIDTFASQPVVRPLHGAGTPLLLNGYFARPALAHDMPPQSGKLPARRM